MSFTLVVLEDAFAASVAATLDMLRAARTLGARSLRFQACSVNGGFVRLSSGVGVETSRLPARSRADATTWVIPGLGMNDAAAVRERLARPDALTLSKLIARHVSRGGRVAAACTSVFLLQQAGVLPRRRVTTTWWLAGLLAEMETECVVDANAMVCADGPILTAGAAFAQTDLMLHLLREHCGARLVDMLARTLLLDGRQAQARFIAPELLANGDTLIARISAEVEAHFPNPPSVATLASRLGMTERTLSRHVRRVTGQSPLALVHSLKSRRAQALLQATHLSVDDVAAAVGYQDAGTLRRLLKKLGVAPPRALRSAASPPPPPGRKRA
ncbi:AraC family transcriptional regulator [Myxococcus stipitatus DSM 14675]|uniref:AraC family transcriptional regulator n=1 Tax=Myxococcus stipitatus (strain DSM 14675 / JCM 12634 / Mx s8) TaxID=1278073 RepID=L7U511_MYXSD|nr:helix-turn-helix domain-containing protein [Myxococcus stipitatus]AGC43233.1 AraC family transcriptional regulator [Myxococcus stipitatus DSM 14675]